MQEKLIFQNSNGDNLVGVLTNPSGSTNTPIVVMCHGFSSGKDGTSYKDISSELVKKGFATFRFDFFGHGESDGKFEDITLTEAIDDASQAIAFVQSLGYTKIGLLGGSFGGITALFAAAKNPELFMLALKSPVVNYREKVESGDMDHYEGYDELDKNGYCYYLSGFMGRQRLKKTFFDDVVQYDGYVAGEKISIPTIIVHGDHDQSVAVEQSKKLQSNMKNCTLEIIKGADHTYTDPSHYKKMIQLFSDFIAKKK